MEGVVMSQQTSQLQQNEPPEDREDDVRARAIQLLIDNGTGMNELPDEYLVNESPEEREFRETNHDTELAHSVLACDVQDGHIGNVDAMLGKQIDECPYMDARGLDTHGEFRRLATGVIIDSFSIEAYEGIKVEFTPVYDEHGNVVSHTEDRSTGAIK